MLFSYALLFFQFTTFVAAAPTQKWSMASEDLKFNRDFLVANGGVWTRDKPESNSPVDQIKWVIKEQITMFQTKIQELYVKVEGKEYAAEVVTVDKLPGSYLIGTWERKGTRSKIEFSVREETEYKVIDFKALNEGEWEKEKVKGLPSGLEVFEEHIAFLIDAGGMWNGVGRLDKIKFSETRDRYNLKVLTSEIIKFDGSSTEFQRWFARRTEPEENFFDTVWERKATGSKIKIVKGPDSSFIRSYYFKTMEEGTWKGESAH